MPTHCRAASEDHQREASGHRSRDKRIVRSPVPADNGASGRRSDGGAKNDVTQIMHVVVQTRGRNIRRYHHRRPRKSIAEMPFQDSSQRERGRGVP